MHGDSRTVDLLFPTLHSTPFAGAGNFGVAINWLLHVKPIAKPLPGPISSTRPYGWQHLRTRDMRMAGQVVQSNAGDTHS